MLWDYETGEFDRTLKGHTLAVQDIAFDQAGKFLGTAAHSYLTLWFACLRGCHSSSSLIFGNSLSFVARYARAASCSADLSVKLWDLSSWKCVKTLQVSVTIAPPVACPRRVLFRAGLVTDSCH